MQNKVVFWRNDLRKFNNQFQLIYPLMLFQAVMSLPCLSKSLLNTTFISQNSSLLLIMYSVG